MSAGTLCHSPGYPRWVYPVWFDDADIAFLNGMYPHHAQALERADMDHGSTDHGDGMMSADRVGALTALSGAEFDRQWLTMMIEHHEGAIEMANTELADGENPDAKRMATDIVTAQQREIADMQAALG